MKSIARTFAHPRSFSLQLLLHHLRVALTFPLKSTKISGLMTSRVKLTQSPPLTKHKLRIFLLGERRSLFLTRPQMTRIYCDGASLVTLLCQCPKLRTRMEDLRQVHIQGICKLKVQPFSRWKKGVMEKWIQIADLIWTSGGPVKKTDVMCAQLHWRK